MLLIVSSILSLLVAKSLLANTIISMEDRDLPCTARVLVVGQETLDDPSEQGPISVYESQIREVQDCSSYAVGDRLFLAAPGGLFKNYRIEVNGLVLSQGSEAIVHFNPELSSLNTPILLRARNVASKTKSKKGFNCSRASNNGPSLFWKERTVVMHPAVEGLTPNNNDLTDAIQWASAQWSNQDSSDFRFELGEPVSQRWIGYDWTHSQPNHNIVTIRTKSGNDFYSEWLHAAKALAITTVTYVHRTGEIVDADVELNGIHFEFTNCQAETLDCMTKFDLKNTLTHEFGHVLGLDHSDSDTTIGVNSVMLEESHRGETRKRSLYNGDIQGLSYIYPIGKEAQECFGVARTSPPQVVVSEMSGCTQNKSVNPSHFLIHGLLFVLLLIPHVYRFIGVSFPARFNPCWKIKSKLPLNQP